MITIVVNGKDRATTIQCAKMVLMLLPQAFKIISILKGVELDANDYIAEDDAVTLITNTRIGIDIEDDAYSAQACRLIHTMLPYVTLIEDDI